MGTVITKKSCCQFCHMTCGITAYVEDGRLVRYEPEPNFPLSGGWICSKAARGELIEWLYHPDQLMYPLKRAGKRGEGKWERISWEKALDEIAGKLESLRQNYGAESVCVSLGTSRTYGDFLRKRWANLFGTPNTAGGGLVCKIISLLIDQATIGWDSGPFAAVPGLTKTLFLWGSHLSHSNEAAWRMIKQVKKLGTKIVCVDPRFTEEAALADLWLQLRPGTDVALLLGMANVIIREGLIDKEFIDSQCHGYEQFKERAMEYPPDKVAEITWVQKDKIIEAARLFGAEKPASISWGVATDQIGRNQNYVAHTKNCLRGITGNLDRPGANTLTGPVEKAHIRGAMELNDLLPKKQKDKKLGSDRWRVTSWACYDLIEPRLREYWDHPDGAFETEWLMDAIWPLVMETVLTEKPYPIKALICQSNNPVVAFPNSKKTARALTSENMELIVVNDYWITPSAALADYILPAASHLEDDYGWFGLDSGGDVATFFEAAVEPLGERKPDIYLWRELGLRLGQEEHWPFKTTREMWSHMIEPLGITWEEVMQGDWRRHIVPPPRYRKYEEIDPKTGKTRGWGTLTGKVELYSTVFEKLGYDPLPHYVEPGESPYSTPELAKEYPVILTTGGRVKEFYHSEHRQIKSLRSRHPWPLLDINPEAAYDLGIADGDWVYIETATGKCRMKAHFNPGIDPRVVHAEHSWWYPESDMNLPYLGGAFDCNINAVIPDNPDYFDEVGGAFPLRAVQCKVYKAKESFHGQSLVP